MESDTTIRRIKALQPGGTHHYSGGGASSSPSPQEGNQDAPPRWSGSSCGGNGQQHRGGGDRERKPGVGVSLLGEPLGALLVSVFIASLWALVQLSLRQLVIGTSTGDFNAVRARRHLEHITSVGPRPVGSPENEVLTVGYLLEQIRHVEAEVMVAGGPHRLSVDVQRPTGSFSIDFLGGFTSFYDGVTNVAVRLEPRGGASHLMLANCHFDTVANSPGASDDAVSCAVMLEVLHSMANLSTPLRHGVVFLFNGAEENVLQASHGFITQHPWAKQVRAFINLEAAGVGGPENPWLVQAYVQAAKHPFASVVGQEVFQSGIIPSDTDFRIYRDFGNIPGIDLAFIENGYIYHTKYDTPDRILTDSIQRAGCRHHHPRVSSPPPQGVVTTTPGCHHHHPRVSSSPPQGVIITTPGCHPHHPRVSSPPQGVIPTQGVTITTPGVSSPVGTFRHLVMSDELADSSEYRHGNMVFFDLLGVVVVAYPARVGTILNYLVAAATFCYLARKASRPGNGGGRYVRELACAAGVTVLSWVVTLLTVLMVALVVTLLGRSMFWYTHFYAAVGLYGAAATGSTVLVHTLAKNIYYGGVRLVVLAELYFDGLCSAYVPMLMVAFPLAAKILLAGEFRRASGRYCVLYLLGLTLPYVHFMFLIWVVFEIFTPILGRSGTELPPELVLATLVTLATIFLSSFFAWAPCSRSPDGPRPKRVFVQHTTRTFHDLQGAVESRDSGLWVNSFDYTAMQYVTPFIPELDDSTRTECREDRPFCGYPWFLPVKFLSKKNWYLPAPEVAPSLPVEFALVSRKETARGTVKMTFRAKGPSHMSLYLMPHRGASLSSWSFGDGTPPFDLSGEYFVFYSHGLEAPAWTFWFEIQPPKDPDLSGPEGVVSVGVSSHHFFGPDQRTAQMDALLRRFPDWAFPSSWVSTYTMFRY
ncbi:hypothetical protein NHX12_027246 [Muraenolepis orangiensis]|uniref:Endoplasmic reticulum metallopeptidase 1 n=1 Tax=Muraenolepis orangiensis TaxID=630683 RepID=A0A9Q0EE94_9TELE|nr:hypothetical protein NHX12_027246 [Muraenolepis orangiensis]